ncbi:T9SS type A sorting domain-containing protein [Barnesiella intestinihominis]|uniref:T9SS type A sorting domain-containing protein n=1 Tax=Barnesiella intestinihominis TaxID=487174 RepID=UPI003AF76F70
MEGTPVTTDEFVDNVVYTDQKLFAEDEPIPALNEGTTKNIAIAADGIAAGAGIVVEGVPTVDQRGKSRSATNPAIGSYEVEKATSIERVAVEKLFWPNPAQGNINLTEGVLNITIYDLQGSLVKEVAMPAQSVSVEGLNPGIYLIRITLNGNEHNHRLVIK